MPVSHPRLPQLSRRAEAALKLHLVGPPGGLGRSQAPNLGLNRNRVLVDELA